MADATKLIYSLVVDDKRKAEEASTVVRQPCALCYG